MKGLFKNKLIRTLLLLTLLLSPFGLKYRVIYNEGDSMDPTIKNEEWVIVEKAPFFNKKWKIKRYDIVIIKHEKELLTKRVVGLPGDSIEIKGGVIYLNEKKIRDPFGHGVISFYLVDENDNLLKYWNGPEQGKSVVRLAEQTEITVPENCVWVIGDNRAISWFGVLKIENIRNKLIIY